jgi:hypothetical protein
VIARKAVQIGLLKLPKKTVKELVAEGFAERQQKREMRRQAQKAKGKAYLDQQRAGAGNVFFVGRRIR